MKTDPRIEIAEFFDKFGGFEGSPWWLKKYYDPNTNEIYNVRVEYSNKYFAGNDLEEVAGYYLKIEDGNKWSAGNILELMGYIIAWNYRKEYWDIWDLKKTENSHIEDYQILAKQNQVELAYNLAVKKYLELEPIKGLKILKELK